MSDDLIRRSDAKQAIYELLLYLGEEDINTVVETVMKDIPTADRPQEWIPCSERLPKESGEYLVYCEIFFIPDHVDEPGSRKGMATAYYHREFNEWLGMDKVYAWMPLPKPWKGADDETADA